jgi:hypothetical protein
MEYLGEILWYISLPIMIYLSYKFVLLNLKQFEKIKHKDQNVI